MNGAPLITIVTAVRNGERFLEQTIRSVLDQDYGRVEYIIIDGASTDGTIDIIKKYEHRLAYWKSEKDAGLYDALNKGFEAGHGDIMAWLNAGDTYFPWTVATVARIFQNSDAEWITGAPCKRHEIDTAPFVEPAIYYPAKLIELGLCHSRGWGFIQQESTFWSRRLWQLAGGRMSSRYRLAGDFDLWTRLARHAPLRTVPIPLASFLIHDRQLSSDLRGYFGEISQIARLPFIFGKVLNALHVRAVYSLLMGRRARKLRPQLGS